MALLVPASEASLRYIELNSPHVEVPDDVKTTSNVVQHLVKQRYNEKLDKLLVRSSSRRSTTRNTGTDSTPPQSEEDLNDDDFFAPVEFTKPMGPEDDATSGTSYSTRSYSGFFGEDTPPPSPETAPKIIVDDAPEVSTTTKCCCCWNTSQPQVSRKGLPETLPEIIIADDAMEVSTSTWSRFWKTSPSQKCWPRREDLEREANEIYRQERLAVRIRALEKRCYRYFTGPKLGFKVEEILSAMHKVYKSKRLDESCKTESSFLLNNAYVENKLQLPPCAPIFLIKSMQFFDIELVSSEMPSPNSRRYTFGIFDCDNEIRKTELQESESEHVAFKSEHGFQNLPYDFEIRLRLYQFCVEERSTKRGIKHWMMACFNRLDYDDETPIKFDCIGVATISREHFMNGQLKTHVHRRDVGMLFISAKVTADVHSQLSMRDYLHYTSTDKDQTVGWTNKKRWCKLEQTFIKMWLLEEMLEKPPMKCIDLANVRCVRRTLPGEHPRPYSMVMEEIVQDHSVINHYLSHAQEDVIDLWTEVMRVVKAATGSFVSYTDIQVTKVI